MGIWIVGLCFWFLFVCWQSVITKKVAYYLPVENDMRIQPDRAEASKALNELSELSIFVHDRDKQLYRIATWLTRLSALYTVFAIGYWKFE